MTINKELLEQALAQYSWVARFISKQWLDDDLPTDKLDELLYSLKADHDI